MTKKRVLIIDDEPDIRELVEITLGRMQLDTDCAENITRAKQLLMQQTYDLCLTDMHLPDGKGLDLVEFIQQNFPRLPPPSRRLYPFGDSVPINFTIHFSCLFSSSSGHSYQYISKFFQPYFFMAL